MVNRIIFEYFGNCITTVDEDKIWDATEMAQFIKGCEPAKITNPKFFKDGDKDLPEDLIGDLYNRYEDFEAGCDEAQAIFYIYDTKKDIHYFFDIIKY